MDKERLSNDFNGKLAELSNLIKSWNLIDASRSEFDRLAGKTLNNIYAGGKEVKIKRILESELCVTYGLLNTDFDARKLTNEIIDWWNE